MLIYSLVTVSSCCGGHFVVVSLVIRAQLSILVTLMLRRLLALSCYSTLNFLMLYLSVSRTKIIT
ncbi:unnamed protein product [Amoebophrya sp. A25]|nr:unnamed protein product [Amoebophrya sp. A25]|eukprot:GSA25T00024704001.1